MSEKHLKPHQYYSDLYDKFTVENCRRVEKTCSEIKLPEYKGEKIVGIQEVTSKLYMYFVTGDEYANKSKTIDEWMERDRKHDELYETAEAPKDITCLTCGRLMFETFKTLHTASNDKEEDRILFMYDCPLGHIPHRAFFNDGKEWRRNKPLCPKCKNPLSEVHKRTDEKVITTATCGSCGHTETSELDLTPTKPEEPDPNFSKDRERFCLSEKYGQEYIAARVRMEQLSKLMKEIDEKKENKDLYDKVAALKKPKIIELEESLIPILEAAGYVKLQFQTPQVGKDICVPFIVYDAKAERTEYDTK